MTLLALIAPHCPVMAQSPALVAANLTDPTSPRLAEPGPELPAVTTDPGVPPPMVEPLTDLPVTPAPQIDAINLFPNQGEITSGFNNQRFGYVLHGSASAVYDSNIFIQSRNEQEDFIFRISPGVSVGFGEFKSEMFGAESFRHRFDSYSGKNYFFIDYSPSYTWYVDHSDIDSFDQSVRLQGEWTLQRLTFGLRGAYVSETVPVEDIGNLVEQKRLNVALTSRYEYSGKTAFEVNGYFDGLSYDGQGDDSREWRNEDWLNYQISPKINLGIGGTFAYVERDSGPAQNYEQARLRAIYAPSEKLTLSISGGMEWRETDGADTQANGAFQFDAAWSPYDGAYVYVQGYRRSVTGNTDGSDFYVSTGAAAQYRQRFLQRFFFALTAEYQNSDYQEPSGSQNSARSDDLFSIRPGVGFDLAAWLNCQLTGEYRQNNSSEDKFSYKATRATLSFSMLF